MIEADTPAADTMVLVKLAPLRHLLDDPTVTGIQINRPGEVRAVRFDGTTLISMPGLTLDVLKSLSAALVSRNRVDPCNSITLSGPFGTRVHVMQGAVIHDGFVIVIRKHLQARRSLEQLADEGSFDDLQDVSYNQPSHDDIDRLRKVSGPERLGDIDAELLHLKRERRWVQFFRLAIVQHKNHIAAGSIGSGKTTFGRALIGEIPLDERIVTVEDNHELSVDHPNRVHVLYGSGAGKISAAKALEDCLRIDPDRIMIGELRGDEARIYIELCNTGHPGSVTTVHANSAIMTPARVAQIIMRSGPIGSMDMRALMTMLYTTLDVIVWMEKRRAKQVFFDPIFARSKVV